MKKLIKVSHKKRTSLKLKNKKPMIFDFRNHSYINEEGEFYTSATSFIKKFHKPFDREKMAAKTAKKQKKTVAEVIAEWDKLGNEAVKKGTSFHKIKEDELLGKQTLLINGTIYTVYPSEFNSTKDIKTETRKHLESGIYPELIVWSDKYKIAGQADYVEITQDNKINIRDYKTSKEIKLRGWEKWDGTTEKMFFPLHNLDDCNFNHYCLQLNLYAFLIKQHNRHLKVGKLFVDHIKGEYDPTNDTFSLVEIIPYEVPDLQEEIKTSLEFYKNK